MFQQEEGRRNLLAVKHWCIKDSNQTKNQLCTSLSTKNVYRLCGSDLNALKLHAKEKHLPNQHSKEVDEKEDEDWRTNQDFWIIFVVFKLSQNLQTDTSDDTFLLRCTNLIVSCDDLDLQCTLSRVWMFGWWLMSPFLYLSHIRHIIKITANNVGKKWPRVW